MPCLLVTSPLPVALALGNPYPREARPPDKNECLVILQCRAMPVRVTRLSYPMMRAMADIYGYPSLEDGHSTGQYRKKIQYASSQ